MKNFLVLFCFIQISVSQLSKDELDNSLNKIYTGKAEVVLKDLTNLKTKFPNDPSVIYLDAILTVNGEESAKKFLKIINNFPTFYYRKEALYKIYSYHYTRGEYISAEQIFNQLKSDYPDSDFKRIETLEPKISKSKDLNIFAIQCGAFSNKQNAEKLIEQLNNFNIRSIIKTKDSNPDLFFVVVDGFVSIEDAQEFILKLKNEQNISAIIFK